MFMNMAQVPDTGAAAGTGESMKTRLIVSLGVLAFIAACSQAPVPVAPPAAEEAVAETSPCPDDGARFAGTGLCIGRSVAYLDPASSWALPSGCDWAMNEALIADGSEALLYRAAVCDGVTTQLEVAIGAHSASVNDVTHGADGPEVIRLFLSDPENPQWHMKDILADVNANGEVECEIRPAGIDGWPEDALVIAPTAEARAAMPQDEPVAACGGWGLDEDATQYWEVRQGYEWFFHLGQDIPGFDPFSITHIVKGEDGNWSVAE